MERIKRHKQNKFTVIDNIIFRHDKEMSLKAIGLYCKVMSFPENWNFNVSGLVKISKEGRTAIDSALLELSKFRYVHKEQVRNEKGQFEEVVYHFFENPSDNTFNLLNQDNEPFSENPNTGLPHTEKQEQLKTNQIKKLINNNNNTLFEEDNFENSTEENIKPKRSKKEKPQFIKKYKEVTIAVVAHYNRLAESNNKYKSMANYIPIQYAIEFLQEQYDYSLIECIKYLCKYLDYRHQQTKPDSEGKVYLEPKYFVLNSIIVESRFYKHFDKMLMYYKVKESEKETVFRKLNEDDGF